MFMSKLAKSINAKREIGDYGFFKAPVRKHSETEITWVRVDCSGIPLGRVASKISAILLGKHDPKYTDNVRSFGVICENPKNIVLTGEKAKNKVLPDIKSLARSTSTQNNKDIHKFTIPNPAKKSRF